MKSKQQKKRILSLNRRGYVVYIQLDYETHKSIRVSVNDIDTLEKVLTGRIVDRLGWIDDYRRVSVQLL